MILRLCIFLAGLLVIPSMGNSQNTFCMDCSLYGFCNINHFNQTFAATSSFIEEVMRFSSKQCPKCVCPDGFSGDCCEQLPSPCEDKDICFDETYVNGENHLMCQQIDFLNFECVCEPGWTGQFCNESLAVNFCMPENNQCNSLGTQTCISFVDSYICACSPNFTGAYCEICNADINPCQNNGTCFYSGHNQYYCKCRPGFTGPNCDVDLPCEASNPCQHGGRCSVVSREETLNNDNYMCECLNIWMGKHCEDYNACSQQPCRNNGTCWPTGHNQYECECAVGFHGLDCEINIDFCEPDPCAYDATCVDMIGDYQCMCPAGTSGKNCENKADNCLLDNENSTTFIPFEDQPPNKCQLVDVNATCVDGLTNYTCICSANFTGARCDITLLMWSLLESFPNPEDPHLIQFVNMIIANPTLIQEITPFFNNNGSAGNSSDISWELEDLFIWASFQGQELNLSSEITKMNHPTLGNCFTFNDINNPTNYSSDAAGEDYGFQALMKVREDEYLPWTKLAALQVFIHARDEMVFSENERYFAEPGLVSQFIISSTVYARLGGIYGACVNNTSDLQSYYYLGKYTNYGCVLSCYQNVVHLTCGCTDPRFLGIDDPKIKVCPLSKGSCVLNVTAALGDPYTWSFCDCPVSCNDTQYSAFWYSSQFSLNPAECITSKSGTSSKTCREEVGDQAMISVYFGLNSQISFEEKPSMNINEYISLFGGVTGIIAGFCIVTVVDFFFLVYRVLLTFCTNESVSLDEAGVQGEVDDEAYF